MIVHTTLDQAGKALTFARAHRVHERVSPEAIACAIMHRTVDEALAIVFAWGYQEGFRDGQAADTGAGGHEGGRRRHVTH